ncbi:MAG TPA: hypothetical protein VH063_00020 [Gaiellaceae bacterium]|jgi:hypothetical protein|nr:hypothetical protein [Gaiellaceae bacterium]
MAYREIHDDVPLSRTLNQLSHFEERLYWRMLSQTDAWGRLSGELRKIRLRAIPELAVTDDDLDRALRRLVTVERVDVYIESGVTVSQIVDFDDRQHVAKLKRAPSRFPTRTTASTSPYDLPLSLPLPETGPEACDLPLSNVEPIHKHPAKSPIDREKTEREDRREIDLPTAVSREPARGLSVSETIRGSLEHCGRSVISDADIPARLTVPAFADLPASAIGGFDAHDPRSIAARLRDADDGTVNVLAKLRSRLPPAAFLAAMESLEERRGKQPPLRSDVRYVVGALKTMLREGTYQQGGAAA